LRGRFFKFSVEPTSGGRIFPGVSILVSPKTKPQSSARITSANKVFWARPANAELDRSGDWLLKNLTTTRARVATRAGPV
jgi:hypothetical protein